MVVNSGSLEESGLFVRVEQIISDSNSEDCQEYIVELSVLTPKIYEYDKEIILPCKNQHPTENYRQAEKSKDVEHDIKDTNIGISIENYRPFFVFVTIRISKNDFDKFSKLENKWLNAEFQKYKKDDNYLANFMLLRSARVRPIIEGRYIKISNGPCIFNGKDINVLTKNDYDVNQFNNCLVVSKPR